MRRRRAAARLSAALALLATLALAAAPARGDVLHLRDGRRLEGTIVSEDERGIRIALRFGEMTVARHDVLRIERGATDRSVYLERARALPPDDAEGHAALARFCEEAGLATEARAEWEAVLGADAENAAAHEALGHVRGEAGAWVDPAEARRLEARARERALRAELALTICHFQLERATIEEMLTALGRASGFDVRLEAAARRALQERRFRMSYDCTDRPADLVLDDICRYADLDYIFDERQLLFGERATIRRRRLEAGLAPSGVTIGESELRRMLDERRLTVEVRNQPLRAFVRYLEEDLALRVVVDDAVNQDARVTYTSFEEPLADILEHVFARAGVAWSLQGNVIFVTPRDGG